MVLAYHGTSADAAELIAQSVFRSSENSYDWLGRGVYFWQEGRSRAEEWAKEKYQDDWAVVEVEIDLSDCMDLLDPTWFALFNDAYDQVVETFRNNGRSLPRQHGLVHGLDKVVIDFIAAGADLRSTPIGSVRAAFQEGAPAFPGSSIFDRSHIQIAVRDPNRISILSVLTKES